MTKKIFAFNVENDDDDIDAEFILVLADENDLEEAVSLAFQTYCDALRFGMDYADFEMHEPERRKSWCAVGRIPEEEMSCTFEVVPAKITIGGIGEIDLNQLLPLISPPGTTSYTSPSRGA